MIFEGKVELSKYYYQHSEKPLLVSCVQQQIFTKHLLRTIHLFCSGYSFLTYTCQNPK